MSIKKFYKKFIGFCLIINFIPLGWSIFDNPDDFEIKGDFIYENKC